MVQVWVGSHPRAEEKLETVVQLTAQVEDRAKGAASVRNKQAAVGTEPRPWV